MSVAHLDVWLSEVGSPCRVFSHGGTLSVLSCDGVLRWSGGRYRAGGGDWQDVPRDGYLNLPFEQGHLEAEVPPGCYAVVAAWITPNPGFVHINYSTHMGLATVACGETVCVRLYNPSIRLCWDWFAHGLRALARTGSVDERAVVKLEERVQQEFLADVPTAAFEDTLRDVLRAGLQGENEGGSEGA